jgi:hypothetical protein
MRISLFTSTCLEKLGGLAQETRERQFVTDIKRKKGLDMHRILGDGNCLFRAMAHQVYGDVDMHNDVRQLCVDYMVGTRARLIEFDKSSETIDLLVLRCLPASWLPVLKSHFIRHWIAEALWGILS